MLFNEHQSVAKNLFLNRSFKSNKNTLSQFVNPKMLSIVTDLCIFQLLCKCYLQYSLSLGIVTSYEPILHSWSASQDREGRALLLHLLPALVITSTGRQLHHLDGLLATEGCLDASQDAATPHIYRLQIEQQDEEDQAAEDDLRPKDIQSAQLPYVGQRGVDGREAHRKFGQDFHVRYVCLIEHLVFQFVVHGKCRAICILCWRLISALSMCFKQIACETVSGKC